jgi:protein involved in sex pheromone biosynthesis
MKKNMVIGIMAALALTACGNNGADSETEITSSVTSGFSGGGTRGIFC